MRSLKITTLFAAAMLSLPALGQVAVQPAVKPAEESKKQIEEAREREEKARAAAEDALRKAVEAEGNRLKGEEGVPVAPPPPGMQDRLVQWKLAGAAPQRAQLRFAQTLKLEKASFLGISTSPVTAALREQLKLSKGIGLVVDHVEPDSPAAKAGLKQYDILQKLNDQMLINTHQLSVLVRNQKAGDEVKVSYIREGKSAEAKVTLAEKDLPPLNDNNPWGATPEMFAPQIIDGVGWAPGGMGEGGFEVRLDDAKPRKTVTAKLNDLVVRDGGFVNITATNKRQQATVKQAGMTLRFDRQDGSTTLLALDQQGKEIFQGPIDTEDQRKALPNEVADQMETDAVQQALNHLERAAAKGDVKGDAAPKLEAAPRRKF